MKKIILLMIVSLFISCEDDNCEDERIEINARYSELIFQAGNNEEQIRFLELEREAAIRRACD